MLTAGNVLPKILAKSQKITFGTKQIVLNVFFLLTTGDVLKKLIIEENLTSKNSLSMAIRFRATLGFPHLRELYRKSFVPFPISFTIRVR